MCESKILVSLGVVIVLFLLILYLHKIYTPEKFVSKYPFPTDAIFSFSGYMAELKKGVRPGNSPHRSRD